MQKAGSQLDSKKLGAAAVVAAFIAGVALTFFYLQQSTQPEGLPPAGEPSPAPPVEAAVPFETPPPPVEPQVTEAPPPATTEPPPLTLKGVYVHDNGQRAVALIADAAGREKAYRVGQQVGDGYVLKTVGSKSVEIEKDGAIHKLPLERGQPSAEPEPPAQEKAAALTPPPPPSAEFMKWWEENAQVKEPPADAQESQTTPAPEPEVNGETSEPEEP
jgi:hypothetical protein